MTGYQSKKKAASAKLEQEPVALEAVYETIIDWDEGGGKRSRRELARRIVALYTTPQPQREQVVYQLSPTDIYDFAGWLTTRKGLMQVGGAYEAGPMAEAVGEYLKTFPERFATAQREWVGLTEEETSGFTQHEMSVVKYVSKVLQEKNT